MSSTKKITFKIFRFNIETDYLPHYDTFSIDVNKDDVILDILNTIKWEYDGSLSYRRSCRHGICGSCAVKVNGKSILSCKDNVFQLVELFGTTELIIDPQNKAKAFKDMVIDKSDFWTKYDKVNPYLVTDIDENPTKENLVSVSENERISEADYCIQCGACYYACPVVEVNEDYLGPASLVKAFRFNNDSRDENNKDRLSTVNQMGSGIWNCIKCFECAQVCPKEINPIDKITRLHQETFQANMAEDNVAVRHSVGFKWSIEKHGILDEGELVRYSEGNIGVLKHIPEAIAMYKKGKIVMPWDMPKSKNLDEIQKLVEISSTVKF